MPGAPVPRSTRCAPCVRSRCRIEASRHTIVCCALLQAQSPADANRDQAARGERRIRALQAEADRLAAQSRTVFGELRKLEIDRAIKQEELAKAERELARVTIDRNTTAKRLAALEATRVAGTPGRRRASRRALQAGPRRLRAAAAGVGRRARDGPHGPRRCRRRRARSRQARNASQDPRRREGRARRAHRSSAPRSRRCRKTPRARKRRSMPPSTPATG